jgi:hypothetical protein
VLCSDNQVLQFITKQEKLNQRHGKWVEFMQNSLLRDRSPWMEYLIRDGLLFKGRRLCIPKCSMRDNLLKEKHSGGLAGHFGHDKTFTQLSGSYYCPCMRFEVKKCLNKCKISQHAKGRQQNIGLYHPLPIPYRPGDAIPYRPWDYQEPRGEVIPYLW